MRFIKIALVSLLMFGLAGCGGSSKKTPEQVIKALEDNGYVVRYNSDNYEMFDEKLNSYDSYSRDIQKVTRLTSEPTYLQLKIFNPENYDNISILYDEETKKAFGVEFSFDNGTMYQKFTDLKTKKEVEACYLANDDDTTIYYYEGKDVGEDNSYYETADESKKGDADKIKAKADKVLKDCDLTIDDLYAFQEYTETTKIPELLKKLKTMYAEQKPLTNEQCIEMLETAGYKVEKDATGKITLTSEYEETTITKNVNEDFFTFIDEIYNGEFSTFNLALLIYTSDNKEVVVDQKLPYQYDLTNSTSISSEPCTEEFIAEAEIFQYSFQSTLSDTKITIAEFVTFLTTY